MKLNSESELEWTKEFPLGDSDIGYDVIQTNDGGFALVGTKSTANVRSNIIVIKTDANGNIES